MALLFIFTFALFKRVLMVAVLIAWLYTKICCGIIEKIVRVRTCLT
jgi:hypothetical protein